MNRTLLAVLLALPAALEAQVQIVRPAPGWPASDPAIEIHLAPGVDAGSLAATLNGSPIPAGAWTARASADGSTVSGTMPRELLRPTVFNVLATTAAGPRGEAVVAESHFLWFDVDPNLLPAGGTGGVGSQVDPDGLLANLLELLPTLGVPGPDLEITSPRLGAFVGLGQTFLVQGTTAAAPGVALHVAYDGGEPMDATGALDPATGRFALEAAFSEPGLHRIVVAATGPSGGRTVRKVSVHAGEPRTPGTAIEESSRFLLTSRGIHQVGNLIESTLTPDHVYKNIVKGQTVWKAKAGAIKAQMKLLALGHSRLDLALGFEQGLLHARATVEGLEARTSLDSKYLFVRTRATPIVTAREVHWDAWIRITKSPGQGVDLELERDDLAIEGLEGEIPGLPGGLVRAALRVLQARLHEAVQAALGERILAGLEMTLDKYFFVRTGPHASEVLGSPVHVGGELTSASVEGDVGSFRCRSIILSDAPVLEPIQPGWLSTPADPSLPLHAVQDLTIAVDDDVLNAGLYEAFRAGAFRLDVTELLRDSDSPVTTIGMLGDRMGDRGVDLGAILQVARDLPISVELEPMLAPVFIAGHRDVDLVLQVHEIALDVYLELEETRSRLFRLVLDVDLPLDDWIVDHGRRILTIHPRDLSVGVGAANARIDFRVEQMPILEIPFGPFVNLVTRIAYLALPFLLEIASDASLESLGQLPLDSVHVWGERDHLYLSGDVIAPEGENGGEPFVAEGVDRDDTKKKLQFEFCALIALLGGTRWEGLLDVYRRFRDEVLSGLPGGAGATRAYYQVSPALSAAFGASSVLRAGATVLAIAVGLALLVVLEPGLTLASLLAALALLLVVHRGLRSKIVSLLAAIRFPDDLSPRVALAAPAR